MNSGIYTITNKTNGHRYVGSAVNLKRRLGDHYRKLRRDTHENTHLQRAWNLHGNEAFLFEAIEYWELEFLVSMEQWWMNMLRPEYNICGVARSALGYKHTPEARAKISRAMKGRKLTPEHRAKIAAAVTKRFECQEERDKHSMACNGRRFTPETRDKISKAAKASWKARR